MNKSIAFLALGIFCWSFAFSQTDSIIEPGQLAPDFVATTYQGNEINLSDYKGELVLLYFWASWCRPCRMSHMELVSVYHKYESKQFESASGFTVLSISLDRDKESWLNALSEDFLNWPEHVSSFKYWQDPVAIAYQIGTIPTYILIDEEQRIVWESNAINDLDKLINARLKK